MAAPGYRTGLECRAMPGEHVGTAQRRGGGRQRGHGRADGARGHLRRPAHAGADDDLLQPRLDRGPVPRRACPTTCVRAGPARGLGRRHGDRLRDRARRAGLRAAAHDRRARQRRRPRWPPRASTARRSSSSSASRTAATSPRSRSSPAACDGLAGEYPVSVDQPVRAAGRPRRARARLPRGRDRPRPRDRDRADGRLARAGARGPRGRSGPTRLLRAARRGRPRRSTSSRRCSRTPSRPRSSSAPAPTRRRAGRRSWRSPSTSSCPVWTGGLRRPRGLPAGPSAVRRPPLPRPRAAARDARARTTRSSPSARRSSASTPTSRARSSSPGTRLALVTDDPAEAHRSPSQLTILAEPSAVCRGLVDAH